ncbi:hypothetical protein PVAP13_2KG303502 [Panicum virgatum]|uniref:Secreted protein n=1 Tax=Panicum virgatum TaxID=38727 RepID=A0A8T0WJI2_PANVG|nr:hypothetical protein PVAP13_2KG303502 [Panicum virgatum]
MSFLFILLLFLDCTSVKSLVYGAYNSPYLKSQNIKLNEMFFFIFYTSLVGGPGGPEFTILQLTPPPPPPPPPEDRSTT